MLPALSRLWTGSLIMPTSLKLREIVIVCAKANWKQQHGGKRNDLRG